MRLSQNKTVFFSVGLHGAGGAGGRTGSGGGCVNNMLAYNLWRFCAAASKDPALSNPDVRSQYRTNTRARTHARTLWLFLFVIPLFCCGVGDVAVAATGWSRSGCANSSLGSDVSYLTWCVWKLFLLLLQLINLMALSWPRGLSLQWETHKCVANTLCNGDSVFLLFYFCIGQMFNNNWDKRTHFVSLLMANSHWGLCDELKEEKGWVKDWNN